VFQFEWLWVLAFLPLPILVRLFVSPAHSQEAALRVPFVNEFEGIKSHGLGFETQRLNLWLISLAWILFVCAAARPQWLGDALELPVSGRDLLLAVDLSGSMETEDFFLENQSVNRLVATKAVAGEFIDRRVGDRLGLILFGRNAYLQAPLTFDRETVKTLLYESVIGLAGKETAIGDAIGLAVKRLRSSHDASKISGETLGQQNLNDKVLILLTDGANTAGEVEPVKAAELAATVGLKIYTVGIGADEMIQPSFFGGRRVNPSLDLDETTLQTIAQQTGGRYFRARDTTELAQIYDALDKLEPIIQETQSFRPTTALFHWPLGLALSLATLVVLRRWQ